MNQSQNGTNSVQHIPLNMLHASTRNARTSAVAAESVRGLARSIATIGLQQNLVVHPLPDGSFEVVAGARRLRALQSLDGPADRPITCRVLESEADLATVSLAENFHREDLTDAEQIEAFVKVAAEGKSVRQTADQFGVTEKFVAARMRLATVAPVIFEAFRAKQIGLETLQAHTLTDDHEQQVRVHDQYGNSAWQVRSTHKGASVTQNDKRVKLVTLASYREAGGATMEDLFSRGDDEGVSILDIPLLDRMVAEHANAFVERMQTIGFKWVEFDPTDHYQGGRFGLTVLPELEDYTKAQAKALEKLEGSEDPDENGFDDEEDDDQDDTPEAAAHRESIEKHTAELTAAEREIEELEASRKRIYPPIALRHGGCLVKLNRNGYLEGEAILIKHEDMKAYVADLNETANGEESPELTEAQSAFKRSAITGKTTKKAPTSPYSAAHLERLTKQKNTILAASLAQSPHVALASVVAALGASTFYGYGVRYEQCVQISHVDGAMESGDALNALNDLKKELKVSLPKRPQDLLPFLLQETEEKLLEYLAFCAAQAMNTVLSGGAAPGARTDTANQVGYALGVNVRDWYTPDEDTFKPMSKKMILDTYTEMGLETKDLAALKKSQLVAKAPIDLRDTGWVPEPMRVVNVVPAAATDEDAQEYEGDTPYIEED